MCILLNLLHFLQPLHMGCFSPLQHAWDDELSCLARNYIKHTDKITFLLTSKTAHVGTIIANNMCTILCVAGAASHGPEAVLSKLDAHMCMPTQAIPGPAQWEDKTPNDAHELEAQRIFISNIIKRHESSSYVSIIAAINQLNKGVVTISIESRYLRAKSKA